MAVPMGDKTSRPSVLVRLTVVLLTVPPVAKVSGRFFYTLRLFYATI